MASEQVMEVIQARFVLERPGFCLDVDVQLPATGVTAIFGHSGSGKTTLLRCLAGLEQSSEGYLYFCGDCWQSGKHLVPTHQRPLGYVFQEPSLFDHLTVLKNLNYGRKRAPSPMTWPEVEQIIGLLGINHLLERRPAQLSGGEKQRVAIARALLLNPRLLLMDEPLASLDYARKREILGYLERLRNQLSIPIIYVSHSSDEVTRLADHLVVMEHGKVLAQGALQQVLADHRILDNLGDEPFSLIYGRVKTVCTDSHLTEVECEGGVIRMPVQQVQPGQALRLHLQARDISLTLVRPQHTSILNIIECRVSSISVPTKDGQCLVCLTLATAAQKSTAEGRLLAQISAYSCQELQLQSGSKVYAQIKAVSITN